MVNKDFTIKAVSNLVDEYFNKYNISIYVICNPNDVARTIFENDPMLSRFKWDKFLKDKLER